MLAEEHQDAEDARTAETSRSDCSKSVEVPHAARGFAAAEDIHPEGAQIAPDYPFADGRGIVGGCPAAECLHDAEQIHAAGDQHIAEGLHAAAGSRIAVDGLHIPEGVRTVDGCQSAAQGWHIADDLEIAAEPVEAAGGAHEFVGTAGVAETAAAGIPEPEAHTGHDAVELHEADPIGSVADTPRLPPPDPRTENKCAWRVCLSS